MPKWKVTYKDARAHVIDAEIVDADYIVDSEAWVDFKRRAHEGSQGSTDPIVLRLKRDSVYRVELQGD